MRRSLAQGLCVAADWRNAKEELCLASARLADDWEAMHDVWPLTCPTEIAELFGTLLNILARESFLDAY